MQNRLAYQLHKMAGKYASAKKLMFILYGETLGKMDVTPGKLRTLVLRTRDVLWDATDGEVEIELRRNVGYKITKRHAKRLDQLLDDV